MVVCSVISQEVCIMSEEKKDLLQTSRERSSDTIEKRNLRNKNRRLRTWLVILPVFLFLIGWCLGSFVPMPFAHQAQQNISTVIPMNSDEKFSNILEVMSEDWFFAKDIEDVTTRLSDQALYGMTKNEEDPHTSYMSAEEIEAFTQSINRNFIGIGVQFFSTAEGLHMVERVIPNTPAEESGVQPGDIIHGVNGVNVDGMTANEVADLVRGEEGDPVVIDFLRNGKTVTLKIIRRAVSSTTSEDTIEDQGETFGVLQIQQFGETTGDEVRAIMNDFKAQGISGLIIDLRDDGGGYLTALQAVMGCFVKEGTVVMSQEYSDGSKLEIKSKGQPFDNFDRYVILMNENTASAAEVFVMAMKELVPGTVTVGTQTYGKGTVQITRMFDDGSALKYTTSKWVSPSGVWVNNVGITPDEEVVLDDVLYETFLSMDDEEVFEKDTVSEHVRLAQMSLNFLGYNIDRMDGYLSEETSAQLLAFQEENSLEASGVLDAVTYRSLLSKVVLAWNTDRSFDIQLQKALEVLHG